MSRKGKNILEIEEKKDVETNATTIVLDLTSLNTDMEIGDLMTFSAVDIAKTFVERITLEENDRFYGNLIKVLKIYAIRNWTANSKGQIMVKNKPMTLTALFNTFTAELKFGDKTVKMTIPKMYKFFLIGGGNSKSLETKDKESQSGTKIRFRFLSSILPMKERISDFETEFKKALTKDILNLTNREKNANIQINKLISMEKGALKSNDISESVIAKANEVDKLKIDALKTSKNINEAYNNHIDMKKELKKAQKYSKIEVK